MILHDASIYGEEGHRNIRIRNGIIESVAYTNAQTGDELSLELNGAITLPGFINSHDHLEFNCYPALGNKIYKNYTEWGPDIQSSYANTIKQVLEIPEPLRIAWGLYKNLFNGFTTVVNHGKRLGVNDELISVFQDCTALHSPAFEKNWKWKLKNPFIKEPVVMHTGEGTDEAAKQEIDELIRSNWFRKKIIGIHGVSMNEQQAAALEGLVWCPASNYFFLGQTAAVGRLKNNTRVVFGTDSTLTSSWNIQQHFQLAQKSVTEKELLSMLTTEPAQLWTIRDRGTIAAGKTADILVIKPGTDIFNLHPTDILLVIHRGNIRLADESITWHSSTSSVPFSRVRMGDTVKTVQGRPLEIAQEIKNYFASLDMPFSEP
jgi:hypothetical protein